MTLENKTSRLFRLLLCLLNSYPKTQEECTFRNRLFTCKCHINPLTVKVKQSIICLPDTQFQTGNMQRMHENLINRVSNSSAWGIEKIVSAFQADRSGSGGDTPDGDDISVMLYYGRCP